MFISFSIEKKAFANNQAVIRWSLPRQVGQLPLFDFVVGREAKKNWLEPVEGEKIIGGNRSNEHQFSFRSTEQSNTHEK
jgi:hypothetical protein